MKRIIVLAFFLMSSCQEKDIFFKQKKKGKIDFDAPLGGLNITYKDTNGNYHHYGGDFLIYTVDKTYLWYLAQGWSFDEKKGIKKEKNEAMYENGEAFYYYTYYYKHRYWQINRKTYEAKYWMGIREIPKKEKMVFQKMEKELNDRIKNGRIVLNEKGRWVSHNSGDLLQLPLGYEGSVENYDPYTFFLMVDKDTDPVLLKQLNFKNREK